MVILTNNELMQLVFDRRIDGDGKTLVLGSDGYATVHEFGKPLCFLPPDRFDDVVEIYHKAGNSDK